MEKKDLILEITRMREIMGIKPLKNSKIKTISEDFKTTNGILLLEDDGGGKGELGKLILKGLGFGDEVASSVGKQAADEWEGAAKQFAETLEKEGLDDVGKIQNKMRLFNPNYKITDSTLQLYIQSYLKYRPELAANLLKQIPEFTQKIIKNLPLQTLIPDAGVRQTLENLLTKTPDELSFVADDINDLYVQLSSMPQIETAMINGNPNVVKLMTNLDNLKKTLSNTETKTDVPTTKPVEPTTKPVEPTTKPVEPTTKPVEPTVKPVEPTTITKTYQDLFNEKWPDVSGYLTNPIGEGKFMKETGNFVSGRDIFEIRPIGNGQFEYRVVNNRASQNRAFINYDKFIKDSVEKLNSPDNADTIVTVKPGILRKEGDGFIVEKQAQIFHVNSSTINNKVEIEIPSTQTTKVDTTVKPVEPTVKPVEPTTITKTYEDLYFKREKWSDVSGYLSFPIGENKFGNNFRTTFVPGRDLYEIRPIGNDKFEYRLVDNETSKNRIEDTRNKSVEPVSDYSGNYFKGEFTVTVEPGILKKVDDGFTVEKRAKVFFATTENMKNKVEIEIPSTQTTKVEPTVKPVETIAKSLDPSEIKTNVSSTVDGLVDVEKQDLDIPNIEENVFMRKTGYPGKLNGFVVENGILRVRIGGMDFKGRSGGATYISMKVPDNFNETLFSEKLNKISHQNFQTTKTSVPKVVSDVKNAVAQSTN